MKNIKMLLSGMIVVMTISLVGCTDSTNTTGRDINISKSEEELSKEKEDNIYKAYSYMIDDFSDVTFADVIETLTEGDTTKTYAESNNNKVDIHVSMYDSSECGYIFSFTVNGDESKLDSITYIDVDGNKEKYDEERFEYELYQFYDTAYNSIMNSEMASSEPEITEETEMSINDICNKFNNNCPKNMKMSYYEKSKCILFTYFIEGYSYRDIQDIKETMGQEMYRNFIINQYKTGNEQAEIQQIKNKIYEETGVNVGVEIHVVPELTQSMTVAFYRESTGWMVL